MAGTPGNPNHDSKGRFASASGLNRANSTITQRGKARVKEHISAGKAFALGAAGIAAAGVGSALLQGVSRPVRVHGQRIANQAITAGIRATENLVTTHGPSVAGAVKNAIPFIAHHAPNIAKAIASKGSTLTNHVKNMKNAGAFQHSVGNSNAVASQVKPRVRVSMGRAIAPVAPPKIAAPKRAAAPRAAAVKPRAPSRRK